MRILGKIAPVVLVSALALIGAAPAQAHHGGEMIPPDNTQQAVKPGTHLTSDGRAAMRHGMNQLDRSRITTSMGGGDIYVRDTHYGDTGWYGRTTCTDQTWNGKCDKFKVQFNRTYMDARPLSDWKSLGCHEFGHTATLGHRQPSNDGHQPSCMRVQGWPRYLDDHDIRAINNNV